MSHRDLARILSARRLQGVVVMLEGDVGITGTIQDVEDGLLILTNFAGTITYIPLDKISALRFNCNPTTVFTSTATATTVNLGFEELVGNHLEVYRRLLIGTSAGDLVGNIGIVQNATTNASNIALQVGYQSATITLTPLNNFVGNHLLVNFAGLISATTPNFTGVFHIIRGVGSFAGVMGGGTLVATGVDGGFVGTLNGFICPPV